MSGPEQRPGDGRGYYGAGWQQPQPQQHQQSQQGGGYGAGPYAPPPPARAPRVPGDPTRAFAPGASASAAAGAAIAVVAVLAIQAVSGLVGMVGTSMYIGPFGSYGGQSVVLSFATAVFLAPFPFYAGAFLALAFLTPITRRSPLPVVLLRAVLGGAAGTVTLALVGVFTGAYAAVGSGPQRLVIDVLTSPIQRGIPLTAMLLATATAAWLWLGRPRGGRSAVGTAGGARRARPGTPGTVRPADAVPPTSFGPPQPPQRDQQPPQQHAPQPQPQQQQQHAPQQQAPPANPWAPPPAR